jgi:hypothetical protein
MILEDLRQESVVCREKVTQRVGKRLARGELDVQAQIAQLREWATGLRGAAWS